MPELAEVIQVRAGGTNVCALRRDGAVACWSEARTLLGAEPDVPHPVEGIQDAVALTVGEEEGVACARTARGGVDCWRRGRVFPSVFHDAVDVAAGLQEACAVDTSRHVTCRALAFGASSPGAPRVIAGLDAVERVAISERMRCALRLDGAVWCWDHGAPAPVPGLAEVAQIVVARSHACARTRGGDVLCWGDNTSGQLGDGTLEPSDTPTEVRGVAGATWIAAARNATCATLSSRSVVCWGESWTRRTTRCLPDPLGDLHDARDLAISATATIHVVAPDGHVYREPW